MPLVGKPTPAGQAKRAAKDRRREELKAELAKLKFDEMEILIYLLSKTPRKAKGKK